MESETKRPVIVCVDDEPPILAALQRLLRQEPYEVITTADPEEALDVLRRRDVSLMIADQFMPKIAGTDLLRRVKERSPLTARVILTAYPNSEAIRERIHQGIQRLVTKPWRDEELKRTIRELLPGDHPEPPPRKAAGIWTSPDLLDTVLHIECRNRTAVDAISDLVEFGSSARHGLALRLDHLSLLAGSVPTFLGEIVAWSEAWGIFTTLIDRSGCAGDMPGTAPVAVYGPSPRPHRVLIVTDQKEGAQALSTALEGARHSCEVADSGPEALSRLARSRFDVVLLDLALPDSDAVTVARHLHAVHDPTEVVALCTCPDLWDETMCDPLGIRHRLKKPYRVRALLEILR